MLTLPVTHVLVWKHLGGLAQLGSGLFVQAVWVPQKMFWKSQTDIDSTLTQSEKNNLLSKP